MNVSHSRVTNWGLSHISVGKNFTILDIGCGGGRTISKLAALATEGKVYGIDHSRQSIFASSRTNARWIQSGQVEICLGTVSELPFRDNRFEVVTAIETHFWWADLPSAMGEIFRVVKPGGKLVIIAEVYKASGNAASRLAEKYSAISGMKLLSVAEHGRAFSSRGLSRCADHHKTGEGLDLRNRGKGPIAAWPPPDPLASWEIV